MISITDQIKRQLNSLYMTTEQRNIGWCWERIIGPQVSQLFLPQDVYYLREITLDITIDIGEKLKRFDSIMKARGFKRFASGTNRVVYRFLNDDSFLAKVAIDSVGLSDNINEYNNQEALKPFVTKMFDTSQCGAIGLCERVVPVTSRKEFATIADSIFELLMARFVGKFVLEDIGTKYFMNWGIREGFGPVLLDYPYVFKLDETASLYCNSIRFNPSNPTVPEACGGEIDYDDGFNELVCSKCGKRYTAKQIGTSIQNKEVLYIGGNNMTHEVTLWRDGKILKVAKEEKSYISMDGNVSTSSQKKESGRDQFVVIINRGGHRFGVRADGSKKDLGERKNNDVPLKRLTAPAENPNPSEFKERPENKKPAYEREHNYDRVNMGPAYDARQKMKEKNEAHRAEENARVEAEKDKKAFEEVAAQLEAQTQEPEVKEETLVEEAVNSNVFNNLDCDDKYVSDEEIENEMKNHFRESLEGSGLVPADFDRIPDDSDDDEEETADETIDDEDVAEETDDEETTEEAEQDTEDVVETSDVANSNLNEY